MGQKLESQFLAIVGDNFVTVKRILFMFWPRQIRRNEQHETPLPLKYDRAKASKSRKPRGLEAIRFLWGSRETRNKRKD